MREFKILLITPELEYTGALNSFKRMCQTLLNNGFAVDVWSYEFGPFIEELDALGILTECIGENELDREWVERRIFKYKLVVANTVVVYKAVEFIKDFLPVVWYVREAENLPSFFWIPQRKTALEAARKIYVVSEYARDFIVKNYNPNVEVLHNYVDDVFEAEGCFIADKPQKGAQRLKFLALGTIEERKGYDVLVEAFIALPEAIRAQCELHFAGRLWEGAAHFYPGLLRRIKEHPNIFYHGELREKKSIHKLLKDSDVVVVPSRDESCSLVALEGAMMARALILSENIGAKYLLSGGEERGLCVKTGCADALKEAFVRLFEGRGRLDAMGRRAREAYLQSSTYEIYEKNFIRIIQKELSSQPYLYRVQQGRYELYSFDVFDTLIMRKFAEPRGIFKLVKERIGTWDLPRDLIENFESIRMQSEQYFYKNVCKNDFMDVRFEEIYALIAQNFSLSATQKQALMDMEVETERENLLPIEDNIALIERLVREGREVVLISDMYLDAKIIRSFLLPFSSVFEGLFIYVSCEYRKKKNNGALFKMILRKRQIQANRWLHFGDNFEIDCLEAKKLGIRFHHFHNDLLDYERYALGSCDSLSIQKWLGKARIFRVQNGLSALEELGACFGAALFLPYVYYVLNQCQRRGIECLYFIARDGYVLQKISEKIIQKEGLDIQTRYIYGSRAAWKKPFLEQNLEQIALLNAYLDQELCDKANFAFVDVAGTGTTLDYIAREIQKNARLAERFCGVFYLHKSELHPQGCPSFFALSDFHQSRYFVEFFCRALEGQVLGYEAREGGIVPLSCEEEAAALRHFHYGDYLEALLGFVEFFLKDEDYARLLCDFSLVQFYLRYLVCGADKNFVELVGSIPFALDDPYSQTKNRVVAKRFFEPGQAREKNSYKFDWSIMRSTHTVRALYDARERKMSLGATDRVCAHLCYKLGNALVKNAKSPLGVLKLLFLLPALILAHREEARMRQSSIKQPLEYYDDYEEALRIQNFFSYQLGALLINSAKKYKLFCPFVLPRQIIRLHKKRIGRKS